MQYHILCKAYPGIANKISDLQGIKTYLLL